MQKGGGSLVTGVSQARERPVSARAVGSFVPRLTRPVFEKFGFSAATLITDWATIVGADIAAYTAPERLKWPRRVESAADDAGEDRQGRPGATLFLAVDAGRALDVQYKARQVMERINAYFGYRAVSDLRLVQVVGLAQANAGAGTARSVPATSRPSASGGGVTQPPPPREIAGIADAGLRAALERMAAGLDSRKLRRQAGR